MNGAAPGSELVLLKSGFTLQADSHTETAGEFIFRSGLGSVVLPAGEVERIDLVATASLPATPPGAQPNAAGPKSPADMEALLAEAALAQGVDSAFVRSVAKAESGLSPNALSPKGAIGLMQLMPATAATLGVDATNTEANAAGGVRYLRALLLRYHGNSALALAAYNAGPGAVERYRGVPPYPETRQYISRVTREYDRRQKETVNKAPVTKKPEKTPAVPSAAEHANAVAVPAQ